MRKRIVTLLPALTVVRKIKVEIWLLCILCFAIAVRLIFFTGLIDGDDSFYCYIANNLLTGKYSIFPSPFWFRFGMFVPIAFFFRILGITEMSAAMFPLLCSIGSIILVFYFGKLLFNERVGLISAFLLSIFPLDVVMATSIFPDVPLAFFTGLSVFSFMKGEKSDKRLHSYFWFVVSGLTFGIAYLIKELALILLLFFIAYSFYKRRIKVSYVLIVLGFISVLFPNLLYYYWETGDFLFTFKVQAFSHVQGTQYMIRDIWFYPYHFLVPNPWYGFFYTFIIAALGYSLFKKLKNSYPVIIWFVVLFLYLEFGTISLSPIILLLHKEFRFLGILTIPSVLILANFLEQKTFLKKKELLPILIFSLITIFLVIPIMIYAQKNVLSITVLFSIIIFLLIPFVIFKLKNFLPIIILLLISSLLFININGIREDSYDLKKACSYLGTLPEKNIFASTVTKNYIDFYFQYKQESILSFDNMKDLASIHNSYVVVSLERDVAWSGVSGVEFPEEVYNPPEKWKLIKVIENPYSAYRYNTTIYYVGGFCAENLGPPSPTGKWRVGDFVVFSGFLYEDSKPVQGVTVNAKVSFDQSSWINIGTNITAFEGRWEVRVDIIPEEWAGRTVYFRAEANGYQSSIVGLSVGG